MPARTPSIPALVTLAACLACDPAPAPRPAPSPRVAPLPLAASPPVARAPAAPRPAPWVEFTSSTWGFRAEFPEPPLTEVLQVPTPLGALDMHLFAVDRGAWAYLVTVLERLPDPLAAPGVLLDRARDGAVANVRGRLVRETELTREGLPARRLEVVAGDEQHAQRVEMLLILRGSRLYQAIVAAPASEAITPEADRFFAGVHVTP